MKWNQIHVALLILNAALCIEANAASDGAASRILQQAGINGGVACLIGCGDGGLVLALARESEFLILALDNRFPLTPACRDTMGPWPRAVQGGSSSVLLVCSSVWGSSVCRLPPCDTARLCLTWGFSSCFWPCCPSEPRSERQLALGVEGRRPRSKEQLSALCSAPYSRLSLQGFWRFSS